MALVALSYAPFALLDKSLGLHFVVLKSPATANHGSALTNGPQFKPRKQ